MMVVEYLFHLSGNDSEIKHCWLHVT